MTIYLALTRQFNAGRTRAVICGGLACVLHQLAIACKDGGWILRADDEALGHVLRVLESHGAHYRFGAPLDVRWLSGGWSSHFEFRDGDVRIRTDFFTRPPRVPPDELTRLWREQDGRDPPFTDAHVTALMKQTDREKDWPFVGELARIEPSVRNQLLMSRSPRDLARLVPQHADLARELTPLRPALALVAEGESRLREELDRERRALMDVDHQRLLAYAAASRPWSEVWLRVSRATDSMRLLDAHRVVVENAARELPTRVDTASSP